MSAKRLVAIASLSALFLAAPAQAAGTFTVNTTVDANTPDSVLSLREAVLASNGTVAGPWTAQERAQMSGCTFSGAGNITGGCGDGVRDTIVLPAGTYTVTLAGTIEGAGDFDITEDVTVQGAGAAATIVDGNDLDRVFELASSATDVAMSGLTIRNGQTTSVGGGIYVSAGGLTLSSSVVGQNTSPFGGGVYNSGGDLTLVGTTVADNNVGSTTAVGGGIYNEGGGSTLTISSGSVISGNDAGLGGGIHNGGTVTITGSSVFNNDAALDGGGIRNTGALTITSSHVSGNTAGQYGGGILNGNGTLTITSSLLQGNSANDLGGGISNQEATLTINGSSVIGNTAAPGGGGISVVDASATIVNTTLSGNSTNAVGGGLLVGESGGISTVSLNNVTIVNNTADADAPTSGGNGGGFSNDGGDVTLRNTIVAGNIDRSQSGAIHPDCSGSSFVSAGHNLIQNTAGCIFTPGAGDVLGQSPLLPALAQVGGHLVHALLFGSPAIDAGETSTCATHDQRGVARPQLAACDIGAYEYDGATPLIRITNARVREGNRGTKAMRFFVRLSAPSVSPVSLRFKTVKGTAKPRRDFVKKEGSLVFAPGQTQLRVTIRIVGDRRPERREKFKVLLLRAVGAPIADGIGVGTIRDNDQR